MNPILKIALLVIGIVAISPTAECRTVPLQPDSLVLQLDFRQGDDMLLKDYRENSSTLEALAELLDENFVRRISAVCITGSASPEGNTKYNGILALRRADVVRNYIYWKVPTLHRDLMQVAADTDFDSAWLRAVEQDTLVPRRDRVLEILRSKASIATKWANIQLLKHNPAHYLAQTIFPHLRNSVLCVVWLKPATEPQTAKTIENTSSALEIGAANTCAKGADVVTPAEDNTPEPASSATAVPNTPVPSTSGLALPGAANGAPTASLGIESPLSPTPLRRPLFALKTNLLFDAATMVNIELEVPIGQHWSVAGEVVVPWWLWEHQQHCLQLMSGNIEGKYWFGTRRVRPLLTGWFAGLYAGGGYYDLEWARTGYQGEFFIAMGVSGGYAHTINRRGNLRMEYTLGIGYMQTAYRKYEAKLGSDGAWHLYRREAGTYKWLGPTRLKISLVWMLDRKGKGGSK